MQAPIKRYANRRSLEEERGGIADELRDLARFALQEREGDVLALAEAVEEGGAREILWRDVDLTRHFAPESTLRPPRGGGRLVGAVAAIVVFLPVMWTWWGLRRAVEQYQDWLVSGRTGDQSFLQLWTHGFNGTLPDRLSLPGVAFGSSVLIVASMFFILLERLVLGSREARTAGQWSQRSGRLSHCLLSAQLCFEQGSMDSPVKAMDLLRDTADRLVKANDSVLASATALADAATSLEKETATAARTLESAVTTSAGSLAQSTDHASTRLQEAVNNAAAALETSVAASVSDLTESATNMSIASKELGQAAKSVASSQDQLVGAASALGRDTLALGNQMSGATKSLEERLTEKLSEMSSGVVALHRGTSEVADALTLHTGAAQHQISELNQIRAGLSQLVSTAGTNGTKLRPSPERGV